MLNDSNLNNQKPVIVFDTVSKVYEKEEQPAITDVSFSVMPGSFTGIIGSSGCGKSTILKIIAGLEKPTSGKVERPNNIGMVFQSGALFPWLTVRQNIALVLETLNMAPAAIQKIVDREIEQVGLTVFADKYPNELSGGQRQRVGIARALAIDPAVLLLDEPFSALDAKTTAELHDDIHRIWQKTQKTIILVSHSIEEVVSLAETVLLMKKGQIAQTFSITLPFPRRELEAAFGHEVQKIRKEFFS